MVSIVFSVKFIHVVSSFFPQSCQFFRIKLEVGLPLGARMVDLSLSLEPFQTYFHDLE